VPIASMDLMAYSYDARATLAKISAELGDGRGPEWLARAEEVRRRLVENLWVAERGACFDRDRDGRRIPELTHNNLRCMWHGIFTREMADTFVDRHLLDPGAFWTPVPLVSIAAGEPLFRNAPGNNWSGQPQGLTYQRAIGALENYGRFAEVTRLGRKLLPVLIRNDCRFTQQLDPFSGAPSGQKPDGYGPMALAALEFLSRMSGIHLDVAGGRVWWSAADPGGPDFTSTQRWGGHSFRLECRDGSLRGFVGESPAFACSAGVRVVTDLAGKPLELVGIAPEIQDVKLAAGTLEVDRTIRPNEVRALVP
jgi:hypothetical protein